MVTTAPMGSTIPDRVPNRKALPLLFPSLFKGMEMMAPVSYTHLDVYKRQDYYFLPSDKNLRFEVLRQFARKSRKRYTAAFFTSDFYANESINIFFSQGLHVPDELSVTGFDDNIYARLSRPMLTTIRQSPTDKGRMAVKLLMQRIRGEEELLHTVQLPTELIVRESVRNIGSF